MSIASSQLYVACAPLFAIVMHHPSCLGWHMRLASLPVTSAKSLQMYVAMLPTAYASLSTIVMPLDATNVGQAVAQTAAEPTVPH